MTMPEWLSQSLFLSALATGIGIAAIAGPLGAFVVWQRMAYFGDAVSHSAILGIALSLLFGASPIVGIFTTSLFVAVMLIVMQRTRHLAPDTLLGVLSHGMLALGVIALALQRDVRTDLSSYLFGDILSVETSDLWHVLVALVLFLGILRHYWRPLLMTAIHPEIAMVEGISLLRMRLLLAILIAGTVAISIKVIGALLITSLLILPAAAARLLARTPSSMAILSGVAGVLAVVMGLAGSFQFDLPSGPSVVLAELGIFLAVFLIMPALKR